jgi:hypothetical protein
MTGEKTNWGDQRGFGNLPFIRDPKRRKESLNKTEFRKLLIGIMDQKAEHWSLSAFAGIVLKEKMIHQFRSEYGVFVKNFPDYLEGVLKQNPPPEVAADLEENIAEERFGAGARNILKGLKEQGIVSYVPQDTAHPELFKLIPQGFGFDTSDFDTAPLSEKADAFREFLFDATHNRGWEVGAAVATIFLEGKHDWEVFAEDYPKRKLHTPVKDMKDHPLARAYPPVGADDLMLSLVHHEFEGAEGGHRLAAWEMVLKTHESKRVVVLDSMREALFHYNAWRDEIATECGIEKGPDEKPRRILER